jgi:protocatechuate 3,4-dioxygenase beta subunit
LMIVILIVSFVIRQKPVSVSPESEAINIQKKIGSDGNDIDISANCPTEFLTSQTAGPYYKAGSPLRQSLIEVGAVGEKIIITGLVFDRNCNPITNAWLDFWQADGNGDYDNQGWQLRGNQYTDSNGRYTLETVMPAQYSGRPPHIHLKLQAKESSPVLISQLYFPGQSENETDAIFNSSLIVMMSDDGQTANYNFKIDTE